MARTIAELPAGSRITDHISLGVIAKTFPLAKVRAVLAATSKSSVRGCLNVFGISAWHHVVGLFGVQRLADATLQLFQGGMGTVRQLFPKLGAG